MNSVKSLRTWGTSLAIVALAGAVLGMSGCEQKMLTTATIDTTKLLQYDDDYQRLAQQYFNERIALASKLKAELAKTGGVIKDQSTYDKYVKAEADLNAEWLKITREFTEKKMVGIRQVCDKLHQDKGIDLVLLDSAKQPTVEYGAIDVTSDVMVELSAFAGEQGGAAAGEAKDKAADSAKNTPEASAKSSDTDKAAGK